MVSTYERTLSPVSDEALLQFSAMNIEVSNPSVPISQPGQRSNSVREEINR